MKTPTFQYQKGDYVAMKQEAQKMSWTPEIGSSIEESCHQFMNNIKHLMDKHIPKSRRRQAWRSGQDYKQYTKGRNQAKWDCRKAQNEFEKKLAAESKNSPEAFYKYAQSKLKTRTGNAHLPREDGSLTTTDKQKADVLNIVFSSVFTRKDTNNMPDTFTSRTDSEKYRHKKYTRRCSEEAIQN